MLYRASPMSSLRENSGSLRISTGLGGPSRGEDCWNSSWGGNLGHLEQCSQFSLDSSGLKNKDGAKV
jgi:hypothetical protein